MRIKNLVYAALVPAMFSCGSEPSGPPALIPAPVSLTMTPSSGMSYSSVVSVWTPDSALTPMCGAFAEDVPGMRVSDSGANAAVRVYMCDTLSQSGAYCLDVSSDSIVVRAADAGGAAGGLATVRQLLMTCPDRIPSLRVTDYPRFGYRGVMIDVSRHFLPVDELKRLACTMSLFKFNVLHLHLSDSQGWRMWLDSHPEVAVRGTDYYDFPEMSGKFYTHADLQGLVSYASARGVEIIPEIDMPGHCLALLASHPELSCRGGEFEPYPDEREQKDRQRLGENMLCVGNEAVYDFVGDVLDELVSVFPSQYIHMGGDEVSTHVWETCPKCQALYRREGMREQSALQDYFTRRVGRMVADRGRVMIGWEEINDRGAALDGNIITIWQGDPVAVLDKAVARGLDVVMCPKDPCYFDYSYTRNPSRKVYEWDLVCGHTDSLSLSHIRGGQACLWTEFVPEPADMQEMLFPRLCALSEVLWSPADRRDWRGYCSRMDALSAGLSDMGISMYGGENADDTWFRAAEHCVDSVALAYPARIETNMHNIRKYEKEYVFDGDTTTFYSSPYSHLPGDYLSVTLDSAMTLTTVRVIADRSRCYFTDGAELSVSADGETYEKVAVPDDAGQLEARFDAPRKVKSVKIELTKTKNSRLTIKEIVLE